MEHWLVDVVSMVSGRVQLVVGSFGGWLLVGKSLGLWGWGRGTLLGPEGTAVRLLALAGSDALCAEPSAHPRVGCGW